MGYVLLAGLVVNCLLIVAAILIGRWLAAALLTVCAALIARQYPAVARYGRRSRHD
jgi:hypothetical protein